MHIDAIPTQHGGHLVKLENLLRLEFENDREAPRLGAAFSNASALIDTTFESLHALTKESLANYLTVKIQRIINLDAE